MAKIAISSDMLEQILAPYKPDCRYLTSAIMDTGEHRDSTHSPGAVVLYGACGIAESCYIDDTGHFNAVEFNICYNQLVYCLIAACAEHQLLDVLSGWNFEEFKRRQLPDILIAEYSSVFRKPMKATCFEGRVSIEKASTNRKGTIFLSTTCSFYDSDGGDSEGKVLLAIVNRDAAAREASFHVNASRARLDDHDVCASAVSRYSASAPRTGA
jgi:hypothetical protein